MVCNNMMLFQLPHSLLTVADSKACSQKSHIDELVDRKCKELLTNSKSSSSGKCSAIHLEQWMKDQLAANSVTSTPDKEEELEIWSKEMVIRRSEELHLIDSHGNIINRPLERERPDGKVDDEPLFSDRELNSSITTSTGSQVCTTQVNSHCS